MKAPTIHLNGTSPESLMAAYEGAQLAIHRAITALAETTPNARDYYPQGAGAFEAARHEFEARMAGLLRAHADVLALYESVIDEVDARAARRGTP